MRSTGRVVLSSFRVLVQSRRRNLQCLLQHITVCRRTSNCVVMRHQDVTKTALVFCVFQPRAYMPTEIALGSKVN